MCIDWRYGGYLGHNATMETYIVMTGQIPLEGDGEKIFVVELDWVG
jgi:hypothetical protein